MCDLINQETMTGHDTDSVATEIGSQFSQFLPLSQEGTTTRRHTIT